MNKQEKKLYVVTGAAGNLGSAIVRELVRRGENVRAFVLRGEAAARYLPEQAAVIEGDVTDRESLETLFAGIPEGTKVYVIHCAAMVSVSTLVADRIWQVNVDGTRNIIDFCLANGARLVFVSSTGAIPEAPKGTPIREIDRYDPDLVIGIYDKTKAAGSQLVLDAVEKDGLDACLILPSGISGPGDYTFGNVAGVIREYTEGKMPAGVEGTFNCGDSRDMAAAILRACEIAPRGESYILGGDMISMKEVFDILSEKTGLPPIKTILPAGIGKVLGKLSDIAEKTTRKPQRMTSFAVYNLIRNNEFDSSKAVAELGYAPRSMAESISDEIDWMLREGIVSLPEKAGAPEREEPVNFEVWSRKTGAETAKSDAAPTPGEGTVHGERRVRAHRDMALHYCASFNGYEVEGALAQPAWSFAPEAVYCAPYLGYHKLSLADLPVGMDSFASAEQLAYTLAFPDWSLLDYEIWPSEEGFAIKLHFGGHDGAGTLCDYNQSVFVRTNGHLGITEWSIFVDPNYSTFLDKALGIHGPFESLKAYFEAVVGKLTAAGIDMKDILDA